mmetsp:Transcript_9345/g.15760  ORF Transcript_9345/g.15760 Transcript_9345/m.15760 type:complete len:238 (-) Transcript_9345:676-1389(-)
MLAVVFERVVAGEVGRQVLLLDTGAHSLGGHVRRVLELVVVDRLLLMGGVGEVVAVERGGLLRMDHLLAVIVGVVLLNLALDVSLGPVAVGVAEILSERLLLGAPGGGGGLYIIRVYLFFGVWGEVRVVRGLEHLRVQLVLSHLVGVHLRRIIGLRECGLSVPARVGGPVDAGVILVAVEALVPQGVIVVGQHVRLQLVGLPAEGLLYLRVGLSLGPLRQHHFLLIFPELPLEGLVF